MESSEANRTETCEDCKKLLPLAEARYVELAFHGIFLCQLCYRLRIIERMGMRIPREVKERLGRAVDIPPHSPRVL